MEQWLCFLYHLKQLQQNKKIINIKQPNKINDCGRVWGGAIDAAGKIGGDISEVENRSGASVAVVEMVVFEELKEEKYEGGGRR